MARNAWRRYRSVLNRGFSVGKAFSLVWEDVRHLLLAIARARGSLPTVLVPQNGVNINQVGEYTVRYRAQDAAGNWNDGSCAGSAEYVRTIHVVDTLKPVIALHLDNHLVHVGDASDTAVHNGAMNPAKAALLTQFESSALMAEASRGTAATVWLAAAGSCALGIAALVLTARRRRPVTELPI